MSLADEVGAGLDGIAQLRALMASGRKPGIMVTLDFDFTALFLNRHVVTLLARFGRDPHEIVSDHYDFPRVQDL